MVYSPKLLDAFHFAITTHEVHQKQKRKGKDIPYIVHPLAVGLILARAGVSEDTIIAGLLHDTIEDSIPEQKVSEGLLEQRFGKTVAALVGSVTEMRSPEMSWDKVKEEMIERFATFSHDSLLVKSADLLSNVSELLCDVKRDGDDTFLRFKAPKEKTLEHYRKAMQTILDRWPESPLAEDLRGRIGELQTVQSG